MNRVVMKNSIRPVFVFLVMVTVVAGLLGLMFLVADVAVAHEHESWPGIDAKVIGKFAEEHGRPPRSPLINLEGGALLFAFALAGATGGFIFGYNWHKLFPKG